MPPFRNLVGETFGRLTVLKDSGLRRRGGRVFECLCRCGKTALVPRIALVTGNTKSCGCYKWDVDRVRNLTHGHASNRQPSRTYRIWAGIVQRCTNPKNGNWPKYGGRGITICSRWRNSFEQFLADMGECPPGKSIDRLRNHLGYAPGNCRWATAKEQSENQKIWLLSLTPEERKELSTRSAAARYGSARRGQMQAANG